MQRTRRHILDFIKSHGRATLDELSGELGMAPMTVRAHLAVLERDQLVAYEEERGRVGRPRFVFFLTETAEDYFPKGYHTFCNRVLDTICASAEANVLEHLAAGIAQAWAGEHLSRVKDKPLADRVSEVAAIRSEEGALAHWEQVEGGFFIHQHHCPASCVATRHPKVICAAERACIEALVGVPVERRSWIVEGDLTCSYFIPVKPSELDRSSD